MKQGKKQTTSDYKVLLSFFVLIFFSHYCLAAESVISTYEQAMNQINKYTALITKNKQDATLYTARGDLYFQINDLDRAIDDYNEALQLDDNTDTAYYGRGLALGRQGFIRDAISDLTIYIKRHPQHSRAYTKRGVRYLWLGESALAQRDLLKAIELDPNNAEAHDDLGVVLAQQKHYKQAIIHFSRAVEIENNYQKAYHNLAMAYYLVGMDALALKQVDNSLILAPESRDSLLLKSEILKAMGQLELAEAIKEQAIFLPDGNWHEQAPVKPQ